MSHMKLITGLLFILLLQGCTTFGSSLNTKNCDPSQRKDCWTVKEFQLRALLSKIETLEKDLDKLTEAYTFCKDGI